MQKFCVQILAFFLQARHDIVGVVMKLTHVTGHSFQIFNALWSQLDWKFQVSGVDDRQFRGEGRGECFNVARLVRPWNLLVDLESVFAQACGNQVLVQCKGKFTVHGFR